MKTEVTGKNKNGSKHVTYKLEGFSATIIQDLWAIYAIKHHYPVSLEIGDVYVTMTSDRDLFNFALGMQVAFGLCSL